MIALMKTSPTFNSCSLFEPAGSATASSSICFAIIVQLAGSVDVGEAKEGVAGVGRAVLTAFGVVVGGLGMGVLGFARLVEASVGR